MTNALNDLHKFPLHFKKAIDFLRTVDPACYLVGGVIRNTLSSQRTTDLDVAVVGDGLQIGLVTAQHLGGKYIELNPERGISRVVLKDAGSSQIDITSAKRGIEKDLARRDFTMNAMAVNVDCVKEDLSFNKDSILDPYAGYTDLNIGLIKVVSNTSLIDDPARMMRAVRFSTTSNFKIEAKTKQEIKTNSILLRDISIERTRDDLLKILGTDQSYLGLRLMNELGLTKHIIPELDSTKGVMQPKWHFWDVFDHLIETVGNLEKIIPTQSIREGNNVEIIGLVPLFEGIKEYFNEQIGDGHTRLTACKLACLLHDIGKPSTQTVDNDGRIRFLGHSDVGADIAAEILERLRISKAVTNLVCEQIKHHLRPSQLAPNDQLPSSRSIYNYYKDVGAAAIDTLYLNMADYLSTRGPELKLEQWGRYCSVVQHVINKGLIKKSPTVSTKLLSGHDIMERLCLKPGPLIGLLLEKVEEARFEQIIVDKEDAIHFLERQVKLGE